MSNKLQSEQQTANAIGVGFGDGLGIPACLPQAKCEKCGSTNLKDTGSFMVEIHQCQNCGELFCQDSGGVGWDA